MASFPKSLTNPTFLVVVMVIFLCYTPLVLAQCEAESKNGCHDKEEAMKLKIIALDLFTIVKAFALGVILATGYMHVLPDSFDDLMSDCLPENPWRKFPFTTFVAMLSAIVTLMVDSFAMSVYRKHHAKALMAGDGTDVARLENGDVQIENHGHEHHGVMNEKSQQLLRHRVIAQAEYKFKLKAIMVLFFSATTPLGIVLGIGLSQVYSETSPTSLIVVGLLNASSAGLLNYMALVDLLAADFLGPKLQTNMKLQIWSYVAVLLGAGFMSLMAKWA
ncbi:hypothetical protein Gogos_000175 [Gossypium gossypioides]|uniref:Fe(2+) transport protein 1-like n=1 Tax=Gossypium gossypioides TaxID=34282 RepID=A0A7J9CS03_GOSGO|nr:hypothetical protein [Gossypium gossypioides]